MQIDKYKELNNCYKNDCLNVLLFHGTQDKNNNTISYKEFNKKLLESVNKVNFIFLLDNNYKEIKKQFITARRFLKLSNNASFSICEKDKQHSVDLENSIRALFIEDRKKQIEFLYDKTCDYLDGFFSACNYCDFKDNKCIGNRTGIIGYEDMGCCHSFEFNNSLSFKLVKNERLCVHLKDKGCSTKNISCKLFTCKELIKNGVVFNHNKILMIDCFFGIKQKDIIKYNFFKTREELLEKLYEKNMENYIWFLFRRHYKIRTK